MIERYVYKRLADKSAFVVFEKTSYKTFVIQSSFMFNFLVDKKIIPSSQQFEELTEQKQINMLAASGIEEELT
jgi:hypothetical protein